MRWISILIFISVLISCSNQNKDANKADKQTSGSEKNPKQESNFKLHTFKSKDGWGYHISKDGDTLIRQPFIPTIPGIRPFKSQNQAREVGKLMIKKMDEGIFPPGVKKDEIDSLGIEY